MLINKELSNHHYCFVSGIEVKNLMRLFILCGIFFVNDSFSQTPCIGGLAGIYECENVDLIYHVTPAEIGGAQTNEVWGWTDSLDGKEYVILGTTTGVYFYDIADPLNPIQLGILPTHTLNSPWRTFRHYNNYLFVASEASGHGMQVFDLTRLRDVATPPEIFSEDAHYPGFGDCHTLAICEETGYAFACGTSTFLGGLHIVNIQDPLNPTIAGGYEVNGYTHESFVEVYSGPDEDYVGRTVAFCFNGAVPLPVTIVDVTDPSDASTISLTSYPGQSYCHQGWLTADKSYLLINDELDEYYNNADSLHTHIFDVHDLDNPVYMGYHVMGTSIDHNLYISGNLVYESNYTNGLSILDASLVSDTVLTTVAYFDHFPGGDPELFQGEWMSYPYFSSGIIPVTDIYNGMFLLEPRLIRASSPESICADEDLFLHVDLLQGFPGPYSLTLQGLPDEAVIEYSFLDVQAPASLDIIVGGLQNYSGLLNVEVTVFGAYHHYSDVVSTEVQALTMWFEDLDNDGYGTLSSTIMSCFGQAGFAILSGDCDDTNELIHADALGTQDDIDNNCNGIIDEAEMQLCSDLNGDGLITVLDIYIITGDFGCAEVNCTGDINLDGTTNLTDVLILMSDFGEFCTE